MGRHKKTEEERERNGYPDKRGPRPENEIGIPKRMPSGLTKGQQKYWKQLYPHVIAIGSLTEANVLSFIDLCETCYYLESIRNAINKNDPPILFQENRYMDHSTGTEQCKYTESTLSRLYRYYVKQQRDLMGDFKLAAKGQGGVWKTKPKSELDGILD